MNAGVGAADDVVVVVVVRPTASQGSL